MIKIISDKNRIKKNKYECLFYANLMFVSEVGTFFFIIIFKKQFFLLFGVKFYGIFWILYLNWILSINH